MPPPDGANDTIADLFTGHAFDLLRVEADQRRAVRRLLEDMEREIVAQLAAIDPTRSQDAADWKRQLDRLLPLVRETIRAGYREAGQVLANELAELIEIEAEFVATAVNRSISMDLMTPGLTRAMAEALTGTLLVHGAPVSEWWERQAADTLQRFTDEMRLGISLGETNAQLVRRVRGGTENGEAVPGVMQARASAAEALVRSATHAAAEAARQATYQANDDVIRAVVWSATLDTRTTLMCAARDGKRYTLRDKKPIGHDLPWGGGPGNLHWGCRSSSRPETKSWRELGIDLEDLPPATRASMDGQVAADLTFEDWLRRRSAAEQDAILGAGRAELWRDGRVRFRDLLDQNGRELSLAELRARVRQ